jgi:hypothetical protein
MNLKILTYNILAPKKKKEKIKSGGLIKKRYKLKSLKRLIVKLREKIINTRKYANWLCMNYNYIILPKFGSAKIVD